MSGNERQINGPGNEDHLDNPALQNEIIPSVRYEICIQGQVSNQWFDCFDGLAFQFLENGQTIIQANLADKSAFNGLLIRIGELNLTILSIKKMNPSSTTGLD